MLRENYHECLRQSYIKFMAIRDLITLPKNICEIDRRTVTKCDRLPEYVDKRG